MRILVATASRHGSTTRIGEVVAAELRRQGHEVVSTAVSPDGDPTSGAAVGEIDAAVVGAPIYLGAWMDNAEQALSGLVDSGIRSYAFAVGIHDLDDNTTACDQVRAVGSDSAGRRVVFGGAVRRDLLSDKERGLLTVDDHDYTDWSVVRAWAAGVASDLTVVGAV